MILKEVLLKVLIAVVLSGLIGYERERRHRPAGFRTIMLVCLGATLVSIIALQFTSFSTHMLAAVITGIGFLGAGAIISGKGSVTGITTAATVWLIACVGLAIGLGFYIEAIVFVLVSYLILELGGYFEKKTKLKR